MTTRSRFCRSIALGGDDRSVLAEVEDDFHHFRVTLEHANGVVTAIRHSTIRYPWSLCPTAGGQLQALVGTSLKCDLRAALAQADIRMNCTHLFDLACLAVTAAARGIGRRRYDMTVDLLNPTQRTASLARDDNFQLAWKIEGSEITDPLPFVGIGLKRGFVDWAADTLPLDAAEAAILLRRAVFVSGGLRRDLDEVENAAEGARTMGGCFVMREGIATRALRMKGSTRDFTAPGVGPLLRSDFRPAETYRPYPQEGRERLILAAPVGRIGTGAPNPEPELFARLNQHAVFMMGDNPALPRMPDKPQLLDFFKLRFEDITVRHLLGSGKAALDAGLDEKIVLACLLHDISNGCFVRSDHGYWGAQMIAPYVDEEIAWAVQYHQALRYIPDLSVGYAYPANYDRFFGPDFKIPGYLAKDAEIARNHRWYMSSRLVTMFDTYFFGQQTSNVDPNIFTDIIGRHFKTPKEGLGFDGSPVAHMWRTMIWPNNFL